MLQTLSASGARRRPLSDRTVTASEPINEQALDLDLATEGQDHRNPSIQAEIERAREDSNL